MKRLATLALLLLHAAATLAAEPPLLVAVGYGGRRLSSTDGVQWQNDQRWSDEARDDDNVLFNVAFGLGRFIAVGGGARLGHILSTRDASVWTELAPALQGRVATIAFGKGGALGEGRFVAGHDAELLFSTDGHHFLPGAKVPIPGSIHARRSAFGSGEAGPRFVLIGDVDHAELKRRVGWRLSTEDGQAIASLEVDCPPARDVAFGSGHFVLVGPGGLIESSHDGHSWQRHPADPAADFSRVAWTGRRFLVSGGKQTWSSPDGLTWAPEPGRIPGALAWARETPGAQPRALAFSWGGNAHFSDSLLQWQKLPLPPGPSLESAAASY